MDYHIGVHAHPGELDAAAWDALLARQAQPTPFMRHAYLSALVDSGSATPETGWAPAWFSVTQGGRLVGATTAWLKSHSYGEYVFDWAWADAYARHGLAYYPKLLDAVPFTPVPGSRLLAEDDAVRQRLLRQLRDWADQGGLSSAHLLFLDEAEQAAAAAQGYLLRHGVQFHWQNRPGQPYADFADFLATLQRDKRKKIQQERRKVEAAGVRFRALEGADITAADWDFFHRCYEGTYRAHQSTPYLTRDFFTRVARDLAPHWLLFIAERAGQPVAASLLAIDRAQRVAWGRYWGATEPIDCLHFEACYYQPLAWCIAQGFERFEGGAQGEHKMARGLMPVRTTSAHWLAHPQFARAVEDFLAREGAGIHGYLDELHEHSPFKRPAPA
ncbi:GNAT family N-acetyltransferase [Ideonella benzenivorans]|uniref:GNAT family N-acetyltransferase n=1 Tax=Ideonella benzenivorans TaxID=2831643 RepID=UPI001CED0B4D|nr:GNAT family N-acetyltransferase [Ideonella benzenivorans]